MARQNKSLGFTAVEGILIIVVAGLIAAVGWYVYKTRTTEPAQTTTTEQSDGVPQVNSAGDLANAEQYLKDTNIDSELDTAEMDAAIQ